MADTTLTSNADGSNTLAAPGVTAQTTPGAFTQSGGSSASVAAPSTTFDASLINQNQANGGTSPTFPQSPNHANVASDSNNANTSIANPIPSAENIIDNGAQTTPAEAKNTSLLNRVAQMIGMGKTQESLTNTAEAGANVPGLTKIVNDLSTQLNGLNDQATALANDAGAGGAIENKEQQDILKNGNITTTAGLAPKTAGDLRMNQIKQSAVASQALTVKSALYGAQGNLTLAKDAADKAATAQYADQQHQLDYMKALIDANKPQMTKEEKAQADIVTAQLADRQTQINNAKEDKTSIIALATTALKNNPNDPAAQYAAQQALAESNKPQPDLLKAFGLVGKYQTDPVATQQAILNLAKTRSEIASSNSTTALNNLQIKNLNSVSQGGGLDNYTQTTSKGGAYINTDNIADAKTKAAVQAQARAQGIPVLDKTGAAKLQAIDDTRTNLQNISSSFSQFAYPNAATRDTVGLFGLGKNIKSFLQTDDNIAGFKSWRTAAINSIQALAGGTGSGLRINQAEIDAAIHNDIPDISDTKGTGEQKIANLTKQLDSWESELLKPTGGASAQTSGSTSTTKSGAPFDMAGAKAAGYSDADIQAYLASH